jgi:hypothetical protein
MKQLSLDSEPFAENRYLSYKWNRESVISNAPEASGVYGLYNAVWIYVGEADNIQARLLELLAGDNPSISIYGPSGFAFELGPPNARSRRYQEVARRVEPICNKKTFASKAKVHRQVVASSLADPPRSHGET